MSLNNIMPAEWADHECCWMAWPCRDETWVNNGGSTLAAQKMLASIANAISKYEKVRLIINQQDKAFASTLLHNNVELVDINIDDSWTRDFAPSFVIGDNSLSAVNWQFNAWGGKYSYFDNDAKVAASIAQLIQVDVLDSPMFAEGGAIAVDGLGTVLTTETCLLNGNRNPGWTKQDVDAELARTIGAKKVVWLPGDAEELETDGHVDLLAAFASEGKIMVQDADSSHPNYQVFQDNIRAIESSTDVKGNPFEIIRVPAPVGLTHPSESFAGSYINFYFANGAIILPGFGIETDREAKAIFEEIFPDRDIVQLDVTDVALGGGSIHCITQQQPKV